MPKKGIGDIDPAPGDDQDPICRAGGFGVDEERKRYNVINALKFIGYAVNLSPKINFKWTFCRRRKSCKQPMPTWVRDFGPNQALPKSGRRKTDAAWRPFFFAQVLA